jgi:hypothetical protein
MMTHLFVIASFSIIGFWLDSINGKNGFVDELLTPIPLAFAGVIHELTRVAIS